MNTKITISIGVSTIQEQDPVDSILNRADDNLYKAKENGKIKVIYCLKN